MFNGTCIYEESKDEWIKHTYMYITPVDFAHAHAFC